MHEIKLKEGMSVPNIPLNDQDGNSVSLTDFKGQKLIVFFYPKDDTPTCTNEACNLRDNYQLWIDKGYQVLGVSYDTEKSHQKFIKKYNLPYPLIADPEHKWINAFGLWGEKLLFGRQVMGTHRTTFVINENGVISHVVREVKSKTHTEQLLEVIGE